VNAREVRVLAAIAASAVVGVGAVVVAATEPIHPAAGSSMQTGVTDGDHTANRARGRKGSADYDWSRPAAQRGARAARVAEL